ncbi:MAG TPA: glycosyltransferase [Patescibacteria group bacterium]|nr:glycosyltransferase [Patescibacteria group bacterium]
MRVALIHYWLVKSRGGEKVLDALCELFPDADIFTHVYDPAAVSETIRRHTVHTTFIHKLPGAIRHYQTYLPLMPLALEALDLRAYDLVISSESGPAKGVLVSPETLHVCYCHTPMRYIWDLYHDYRASAGPLTRLLMPPLVHYLRLWDVVSANRVDQFIANSSAVARRIQRHYRRPSRIIHPPVDVDAFVPVAQPDDFYLVVGQLVPYKRAELAVEAFNRLGRKLVVIGDGPQLKALRAQAGPMVSILGPQPFSVLRDHYARCRALVFPGEEDFGIVPVEAMASGRPVIALRKGGALDTVVEGLSGLFFDRPEPQSLMDAVIRFEAAEHDFDSAAIVAHARQFDRSRFLAEMREVLDRGWAGRGGGNAVLPYGAALGRDAGHPPFNDAALAANNPHR